MLQRRFVGLVLACALVSSRGFAADEGLGEKKLDELKAASVYVKVEGKEGVVTGSGFLFRVDGDAGLVATNRHVVAPAAGRFTPLKTSIVFHSGTKKEQVLTAEVLALDAEHDLAVLKVSSKGLPTPLDFAQAAKPRETMTVYTFGFPLGDLLSPGGTNPAVTVGKGTVSSLREDAQGKLRRVQLDGEINPGNSGGPVVDPDGRFVGIVVSRVVGTKISFAIPPADLADMLKGRAAPALVRGLRLDNGTAEVEVEVPLIDPLHKVKAVELRHVRKDALKEQPRADKDGNWPDLPGAEKVEVKVEGGKAVARVTLKGADKKPADWLFQAASTNEEGKSVAAAPVTRAIDFGATGAVRLDGPGARAWETITSKEGGFTVDMPAKPTLTKSATRRTKTGLLTVFLLGCETDDAFYLATRIDLPSAPPRGSEEKVLDAMRDYFAEEWNGKVMTEKKVIGRGNAGRDFTVRGKPDERSTSTIRVRTYLVGKSVFQVAVVSAPDSGLPADAGRFLGSLALGAEKVRATGTPEPEPKGEEVKGWGLAVDPDKDCKWAPDDKGLALEVPAALHDLGGPQRRVNAPRVMREVDGDFVITVKVVGDFKPGPKSTQPRSVPYLGAGLLVWSDADNFIRLERTAMLRAGKVSTGVAFLEQEGGYGGGSEAVPFRAGDCYLRLERKGSQIAGALSADGKTWKALKPIDTVWPEKLKVGVTAITTSNERFAVRFEEFELQTKGSAKEGDKP